MVFTSSGHGSSRDLDRKLLPDFRLYPFAFNGRIMSWPLHSGPLQLAAEHRGGDATNESWRQPVHHSEGLRSDWIMPIVTPRRSETGRETPEGLSRALR
jgi:hypothetical protein